MTISLEKMTQVYDKGDPPKTVHMTLLRHDYIVTSRRHYEKRV